MKKINVKEMISFDSKLDLSKGMFVEEKDIKMMNEFWDLENRTKEDLRDIRDLSVVFFGGKTHMAMLNKSDDYLEYQNKLSQVTAVIDDYMLKMGGEC